MRLYARGCIMNYELVLLVYESSALLVLLVYGSSGVQPLPCGVFIENL